MKKKFITIILFLLVSVPVYSKEKIVYLDLEKIMQDSKAGKSIIAQLKKKVRLQYLNSKKEKKKLSRKKKN